MKEWGGIEASRLAQMILWRGAGREFLSIKHHAEHNNSLFYISHLEIKLLTD